MKKLTEQKQKEFGDFKNHKTDNLSEGKDDIKERATLRMSH